MTQIDQQEFGRLQAEVASLQRDSNRQLDLLAKLTTKLEGIERTLSEASGGWKTLMAIGGLAAAFGSVIGWLLTAVFSRGSP